MMKFHFPKTDDRPSMLYALPVVLGSVIVLLTPNLYDDEVHGTSDAKFLGVRETFRQNFADGLEREGASVAVYHKGRRVVQLWGGWADSQSNRKWKHDTRTVYFSATKAIASLCVAILVDRGLVQYEDKVVDFWPEYGKNGKNGTTIEDVLSHKAGLPYFSKHINFEHVNNFESMDEIIVNSDPIWEPGTATGYHAVTFGFLVDGLIRRIDEKGRDMRTFFMQEVSEPYGIDIDIGNPTSKVPKTARISLPGIMDFVKEIARDPRILAMFPIMYFRYDDIIKKIQGNTEWLHMNFDTISLNDPEIQALNLPAVNGFGDADSFAKLFSLALDGTLLSNRTVDSLLRPTVDDWHYEQVIMWPIFKGHGFFYERHPQIPNVFTFGHSGYGGQQLTVDPHNELVFVYVSNALKTGSGELCAPYTRLLKAAYQCL